MSQELQDLQVLNSENVEATPKPKLKKQISKPTENIDLYEVLKSEIAGLKEIINKQSQPKPKKERTEAQKIAFQKARMTAKQNAEKRKEEADKYAEQQLEEYKKKVVQKALSIKKKEIKEKAKLEAISDDETPIEEVKKISSKIQQPTINPPSLNRYRFL